MSTTYALLGATGRVGQSILSALLEDPSRHINAFVRSRAKLEGIMRNNERDVNNQNIQIFEGDITSSPQLLADCLAHTHAACLAIATPASIGNKPGCHVAQDQAHAVVAALHLLRSQGRPLPKRLVVLSSSETDDTLRNTVPWPMRDVLYAANSYVYQDLTAAEMVLRDELANMGDVVAVVFMKPGGISKGPKTGHRLDGERQQTFISYPDVAAGIVELAEGGEEGRRWDRGSVSVVAEGKAGIAWENLPGLGKGLMVYWVPGLYGWLY